jgi:DNA-binding LacI/PurR family transcriptional regulator
MSGSELRCINLVFSSGLETQNLHWLRDEYLAGYTEVMEHLSCKSRYVIWEPKEANYESLLWCHAPPKSQACLIVGRRDPELLQWLNDREVPYVIQNYCLYDHHPLPPHHRVYVNKNGGAFDATKHLIELGHRRIAFVGALPLPDRLFPEYEGFIAAMKCAGITPDEADMLDLNTEVVERALGPCQQLLRRGPTAVVCGAGAVTVALYEAAMSLGLRVPQQLSIIGFDDNKTPAYPQLSTIAVPRHALSRQAMDLLLEVSRQPGLPPQSRVLNCALNYQATIGPCISNPV